jgi:hypothetical protein
MTFRTRRVASGLRLFSFAEVEEARIRRKRPNSWAPLFSLRDRHAIIGFDRVRWTLRTVTEWCAQ